ncbi:hypothetical protein GCM10009091_49390 [Pseudomonas brenneri]|uniref:Uncharacterized protein n=1 Tax=Pseudomonas brenneri TaxID=129817 RepID=A0A5B2UIU9_9PSED|nr:hypothetical protein [Pseudomonas brenneri]KAA2226774.1 hypothetical protein F1720_25220 [Pseudomonas brenneri]TWR74823.1 hypothetical protein FJD34_25045 [Pseudomonas brenneri]GGL61788.1 hypothetical protein GCM10009091_49390 [Pseudomonas brenneri]SDU90557.1 hypothetical protein SAMN04490181_1324 [Pseudomonas brenneri]
MSRSGYSDDYGGWGLVCWRGAVNSALKGKRGQAFLIELRDALEAMPTKRLIADSLQAEGEFCTIGVLGAKRGVDMTTLDPDDREAVGEAFDIAPAMASEIVFMNDEASWQAETPEQRWVRMRDWITSQIKIETA